jgi:hypothetical protein
LAEILPSRLQDLRLGWDHLPVAMNRRFQFRLRTLMIVVTLLAVLCACVVYIESQAQIVKNRKALIVRIQSDYGHVSFSGDNEATIPWVRRLLGDVAVEFIGVTSRCTVPDQEIKTVLPEGVIIYGP